MRQFTKGFAALLVAASLTGATGAMAQGTLRIGMTASDIPLTTGQTDQGGEGMRFMGYTVYDSLVEWDMTSADKPSVLVPGLATEWSADPEDRTKWTFKLREGVTFHDRSTFEAQTVVWNLQAAGRNLGAI
jgi:ABC-type transport system substrate-binding protein